MGNIIRSPLAENLFLYLADLQGVAHRYQVDSAGISGWHEGEPPDRRMRRVAAARGLEYSGRARQFQYADLDSFDLILAMDVENHEDLLALVRVPEQRAKIHLLRKYDPQSGGELSIPDPYYEGIDGFERTYDIVERSCKGLLDFLEDGKFRRT